MTISLHSYQKRDEGLEVFEGSRKKTVIPWETVAQHVADLIAKHEYIDRQLTDIDFTDEQSVIFIPEPAVQMSLFGDEVDFEPQKNTKTMGFFDIDEQIIKTDLMRGSNFQDGKFRIKDFAKTNPSIADFAKFLSKEYGIGGSSTPEGFSNHDGKGIRIDLYDRENGEYQKTRSITLNWNQAAKRIAELVKNGEYITDEDISRRIKHAEYVLNNYDPTNSMDLRYIEEAEKVLALYGMFESDDIQETVETTEMPANSAPEIEEEPDEYIFKVGDVLELDEGIFEVTQVDGDIIELTDTTTDETCIINENELYNTGFAEIPSDEELEKLYTFSERHNQRMKKLFAADRRHEIFTVIYKWSKVAVISVCVSATLTFGILLTFAEVREAIGDVIVTWFEQFTKFQSSVESDDFTKREWSLEYLPDEFTLADVIGITEFIYMNTGEARIIFNYELSDSSVSVDNEDMKYNVIIENDIPYHLFEATIMDGYHDNIVIWDMDGYRFTVLGNYDIDELIKIAISVK